MAPDSAWLAYIAQTSKLWFSYLTLRKIAGRGFVRERFVGEMSAEALDRNVGLIRIDWLAPWRRSLGE